MKMTPFTEYDWYAFNGAECWVTHAGNCQPLIYEGEFQDGTGYTLVIDPHGCCLVIDDAPDCDTFILKREFPSPDDAVAFAEKLGEPKSLTEFLAMGFNAV